MIGLPKSQEETHDPANGGEAPTSFHGHHRWSSESRTTGGLPKPLHETLEPCVTYHCCGPASSSGAVPCLPPLSQSPASIPPMRREGGLSSIPLAAPLSRTQAA